MKYYSDITGKLYDSITELKNAEDKVTSEKKKAEEAEAKKKAERAAAAKIVDEKLKAYNDAAKAYKEALAEYCKKYGSYRYSTTDSSFSDLLSLLF